MTETLRRTGGAVNGAGLEELDASLAATEGWVQVAAIAAALCTGLAAAGGLRLWLLQNAARPLCERAAHERQAEIARLSDDAANARRETARLTVEAEALGAQAANARLDIAAANARISEAEARPAEADLRAAEASTRTEELRRANLELEANLSLRVFDDQGGAAEALKQFRGTRVILEHLPDWECKATAGQIAFTLASAGWDVLAVRSNPKEERFFEGVTVQMRAAGAVSEPVRRAGAAAEALVPVLNETRIVARTHAADLDYPEGVILVRVGLKPNPAAARGTAPIRGNRVFP